MGRVLVIGGGTAGIGAAVAAGRAGAEVTLVEATQALGGVMAACPGMPWGGGWPAGRAIGGLMTELTERLAAMDPPAAEVRPCALENFGPEILYDPDMAALEIAAMLEEAGVVLRSGALATGVAREGARIATVDVTDRRGSERLEAEIVIDCTGDGSVAAAAGVPFETGNATGATMAATVSFHMVGVDTDRAFAGGDPYFRAPAARGVAAGRLHPDLARLYLMRGFHPGEVFCNSVHLRDIDGTDPAAVARATQEGRRRALALAAFLRDEVPGFETARMTRLSPSAGVRETRRLQGLYRLTGEDLARGTRFPDGIVACDNPVDDVMRGAGGAMTHEAALAEGAFYTIPFRSLVPRRVENLLFAGRCLSADPVAFASVRGMPQCMATGQAVGTAAVLALRDGVPVQQVPVGELVARLTEAGVTRLAG